MILRHTRKENGFTLIELLGAISLFAIVIVLSSTLILHTINTEETINSNISLSQNTNTFVNDLKQQYFYESDQSSSDPFNFCFENSYEDLVLNYIEINGERKTIENGCIQQVSSLENLPVKISTMNSKGEQMEVETTWFDDQNVEINIEKNTTIKEYEKKLQCTYTEKLEVINYVEIGVGTDNKEGKPCYTFEKDVKFSNGLYMHNHGYVHAKENLHVEGEIGLELHNHAEMIVDGDLRISEGSILKIVHNHADLEVKGDLYVNSGFTIENHGTVVIHGNIYVKGNGTININKHGNLSYNNMINIDND